MIGNLMWLVTVTSIVGVVANIYKNQARCLGIYQMDGQKGGENAALHPPR